MRFLWTITLWLTLLALPFMTLAAVDVTYGPSTHARQATCTRACHDRGCVHLPEKVDVERAVVRAARTVYVANIRALRQPAFGYRDTNLLVYVVGGPSVAAVLLWGVLWRRPGRCAWGALGLAVGLLGAAGAVVAWLVRPCRHTRRRPCRCRSRWRIGCCLGTRSRLSPRRPRW